MCAQCCAASQDRDVQLIDVADWAAEQHEVATLLGMHAFRWKHATMIVWR